LDKPLFYNEEEVPKHLIKQILMKMIKERKAARRKKIAA